MKKIFITLNIICGIPLILFLITMICKKEYSEVVIEGPIFFGDLFLVFAVSIGSVVIGGLILKGMKHNILPGILIIFGLLSVLATYYTIISIRKDRLLKNIVQTEMAINNLAGSRDYYKSDIIYFQHLMKELKMFHSMFEEQYKFLVSAENIEDKRESRVPLFFGILSVVLFLNAVWLYYIRYNTECGIAHHWP